MDVQEPHTGGDEPLAPTFDDSASGDQPSTHGDVVVLPNYVAAAPGAESAISPASPSDAAGLDDGSVAEARIADNVDGSSSITVDTRDGRELDIEIDPAGNITITETSGGAVPEAGAPPAADATPPGYSPPVNDMPAPHQGPATLPPAPSSTAAVPSPSSDQSGPGHEPHGVPGPADQVPVVSLPNPIPSNASPADADVIHGNPVAEAPYWWAQTQAHDCVPSSVGDIVNQFTGAGLSEADVVTAAQSMNLLGPQGMDCQGAADLLQHYGVPAHVETGSINDLRQMLDQGREVMLAVDSTELWTGTDPAAAQDHADHAVVITGIDDSTGMVYLNDSGVPNGAMESVPISVLESAWADSGHQMVVTDGAPPAHSPSDSGSPTAPASTGAVLLPVAVPAQPVARR